MCVCVCRPRDLAGEDSTDGLIDLLQGLELLHHQLVLMVDCVTNRQTNLCKSFAACSMYIEHLTFYESYSH